MHKIKVLFFAILIVIIGLYARAAIESKLALDSARERKTIEAYRHAVGWYAPLLSFSDEALNEGLALIDSLKTNDERLLSLRELRRGLVGSRSMLDAMNGRAAALARLDSEIEKLIPEEAKTKGVEEVNPPRVNYTSQLLALVTFVCWVGALFWTIARGFSKDGKVKKMELMGGLAVYALFFVIWLLALSH